MVDKKMTDGLEAPLEAAGPSKKGKQGFASMSAEKQRAIASKGGKGVPSEKRTFSQNRELATAAGAKGGKGVANENRSFSLDRALAVRAGRRGGLATQSRGVRAVKSGE